MDNRCICVGKLYQASLLNTF